MAGWRALSMRVIIDRLTPFAAALLIPILWGTHAPVAKACLQGLTGVELVCWNMILGAVGLWGLAGRSSIQAARLLPRRVWPVVVVQGILGTTVYFGALYSSFDLATSVIRANLINYLFPVTTVLFCVALGCEKITPFRGAGLLVAFAGAGAVVTGGHLSVLAGQRVGLSDLLAFLAALSWGAFSAMGCRFKIPGQLAQLVGFTIGAAWAIPFLLVHGRAGISGWAWIGVAYIAIGSNAIAGVIWLRALQRMSATILGNMAYLAVVISALCLHLFFGEPLPSSTIVGLLLILLGAILSGR